MSSDIHIKITAQIFREEKCFGPGVATLLERVQTCSSLRAAAMSMGMAYSKAWTIVKNAEKKLGFVLLFSTTGGRKGGGAVLTPQGKRLLEDYRAYTTALNQYGQTLFADTFAWLLSEEEKED